MKTNLISGFILLFININFIPAFMPACFSTSLNGTVGTPSPNIKNLMPATATLIPFLIHPPLITRQKLNDAPKIIGAPDHRFYLGKNDEIYVQGNLNPQTAQTEQTAQTLLDIFKPAQPLYDPVTHTLLGYESKYAGQAKLQRPGHIVGEAHLFKIVESVQEIEPGDSLVPVQTPSALDSLAALSSFSALSSPSPGAIGSRINAHIVAIQHHLQQAGQYQVVIINQGRNNKITPGAVLSLYSAKEWMKPVHTHTHSDPKTRFPAQQYGSILIFQVFDQLAYGLVRQVTSAVRIGDIVRSKE